MHRFPFRKSPSYPGLCISCEKVLQCTYPRVRERPVFRCLEFEEASQAETSTVRVPQSGFRPGVGPRVEPERREPGLCAECEGRGVCTYPRSPGGVWFCEEYR
jgi:hypothetical protein